MSKFFKSDKKPEVCQVCLFHGDVGENCTNSVEWIFSLPIELGIELYEKYKLPKYLGVSHRGYDYDKEKKKLILTEPTKDVLLLDFEGIHLEYTLDTCEYEDWDYLGDDYRTAKDHEGRELLTLHWCYDALSDDGDIWDWEGYEGDEYFSLSDFDYELPEWMNAAHPIIEITGDDKKKILEILYPIMEKILDGPKEVRKQLYDYCGD